MSLYIFASDAIASLINVTQHEKSAFCNNLAAELFLVRESIQSRQDAKDAKSEAWLRALLRNLERLCKWPQRLSSKSTTTSQPANLAFPALKKLIQDQRSALVSIRLFATSNDAAARDQRKELLQMLKKFSKTTFGTSAGDSSQPQGQLKSVIAVGDDHHLAVLTLYDTLSAHCFCHQTRIDTKIRLREEKMKQMQVPAFNVLFLAHPHQEGDQVAPFWQNTRIGVVSGDDYSSSSQLSLTDPIKHGDLCNRISSGRQLQLSFLLFDRNLHLDEWCEGEKSWITNTNSISLTAILTNYKLNQRGRYLLSFFLARAVCTYYGSNWMTQPWTKENIHFMFERRGSISGVFLNEPFVSAYFHPSSLAAKKASNLLSFSEIYALGIILLELELGSTIEREMQTYPECFAPDGSPVIDADLYTAIKLHDNLYRMEDTHRLLYEVIGNCLRPTVLKPYATEATGFRQAIHKYIVSPLQELIAGSYVEADPEKVPVNRPTVELDASFLTSPGVLPQRAISRSISPGANQIFPPVPQNSSLAKSLRHGSLDNLSSSLSRFSSLGLETEVVRYSHSDYTVGWICALPIEMAACTAMLDETHPSLHIGSQDNNNYSLGKIGTHNVVIACLPSGVYGTTSAATVAMDMMYSFPSIRHRFMVGIGGGIPSKKNDIHLGDVVVCKPTDTTGGVFQHDMGKILHGSHTKSIGTLNKPPQTLLTAISKLQSQHYLTKSKVCRYLDDMQSRLGSNWRNFMPPNRTTDRLFKSDFAHVESNDTCSKCAATGEQTRPIRSSDHPQIYYGPIASGNSVVRDSYTRDRLGEQGFLAFEMEAAGLMDRFPCLVIRGICDYSDSHKNKEWQGYAAAAAAAFAKEVLSVVPAS